MTADKLAGERIRDARIDHGWTPEDMAREIFRTLGAQYTTSARTIERVEAGHRPTVRKQFAIAKVLGMRPSELWGGMGAPRPALVAA
jgi:transcriptional regulator with XRE-family HTH domain